MPKPDDEKNRGGGSRPLPRVPRGLVQSYVDARLTAAEEHFRRILEQALEKVKDEAWETRTWILLLTAASWGALAEDQDPKRIVGASVTLAVVALAGGVLLYRRWWKKRRDSRKADRDD